MRLEFTYTPEDLQESADANFAGPAGANPGGRWWGRGLVGWLLFIGIAIAVLMMVRHRAPAQPVGPATQPVAPSSLTMKVLLPFIPWLLMSVTIWFFLVRQYRRRPKSGGAELAAPRLAPGRWGGGLFGWFLFVGVAIVVAMLLLRHNLRAGGGGTRATRDVVEKVVLPLVPWVLVFGAIWFFLVRQLRAAARAARAADSVFHQPHVCEVDADGVQLSTALASTRWRWPAFNGWTETANLLLLRRHEDGAVVILPKRGLAPGPLDELRRMFRERISGEPHAFPVLPPRPYGPRGHDAGGGR